MICIVKDGRYHGRRVWAAFIGSVLTQSAELKQSAFFDSGVAHASRVLVIASSRSRTFLVLCNNSNRVLRKGRFAATPKPARETRALPRKMRSIAACS